MSAAAAGTGPRARTRRRSWLALALVPPMCGVLIAGLVAGTWLALGRPGPASGAVWMQVTKTGEAHALVKPDRPFFFLALGNDARSDNDPGLGDAIHIIGVNPALGAGTILDMPRDTLGPNGGKINAYNPSSGLRAQADAVGKVVGVPLPFAITTNFEHFIAMVNAIGGIDITIPYEMHDSDAESNFSPGRTHLNGRGALAFSRDRKSFANGDLTRTDNQGLLLLATLATLQAKHPGATDMVRLAAILGSHVRLDGVGVRELYDLGRLAMTLDPAKIRNVTIPVAGAGGTDLAPTAAARSLFEDFADDAVLQSH